MAGSTSNLRRSRELKRASEFAISSHRKLRRKRQSRTATRKKKENGTLEQDASERAIAQALAEGAEEVEIPARAFEDARAAEENDEDEWDSKSGDEGEREDMKGDERMDVDKEKGKRKIVSANRGARKEKRRKSHKEELLALKGSDPKFYQFLKDNDKSLLEFTDRNDEDEALQGDRIEQEREEEGAEEGDDAEWEEDTDKENGVGAKTPPIMPKSVTIELVDMDTVQSLQKKMSLKRASLKAARDLVRYFRAGRLLTISKTDSVPTKEERSKSKPQEESEQESELEDDETITGGNIRFSSAKIYQQIMLLSVTKILPCIDRALNKPSIGKQLLSWDPSASPRWKNIRRLLKAYAFHLTSLIATTTDAPTLRFLLRRAAELLSYANVDPLICRSVRKVALDTWSSSSLSAPTRVAAYMVLRSLGEGTFRGRHPNLMKLLRAMCHVYRETVAATVNARSLELLEFCTESLVDMFGIDLSISYLHAFNMLRDIAVILRAVLTSKNRNKESDRVHNWSIVNTLRVLGFVLQRYGGEDEGLKPLVYPYVQLCTGIARVSSAPQVYGLRICLCRFMINVMEGTTTFIPVHVHLLEHFRCAELRKKPARVPQGKASSKGNKRDAARLGKSVKLKEITMGSSSIDFRCVLRVGEEVSRSADYLSGVVKETLATLGRFFAVLSRSVAYPEIAHRAITDLRQVCKEVRHPDIRRSITVLTTVMKENETIVIEERSRWKGTPNGIARDNVGSFGNVLDWGDKKTPMERYWDMERKRIKKEDRLRNQREVKVDDERNLQEPAEESETQGVESDKGTGDNAEAKREPKQLGKHKQLQFMTEKGDGEEDEVGRLELTDEDDDSE